MDRYEAEALLEAKPEGSFLLRDSAQEEYLFRWYTISFVGGQTIKINNFSVSFRRYGRSLHARIEEQGHKFSFDCHDPGVFMSKNIPELLHHYKVQKVAITYPSPLPCKLLSRLSACFWASVCLSIFPVWDISMTLHCGSLLYSIFLRFWQIKWYKWLKGKWRRPKDHLNKKNDIENNDDL